MIGALRGINNLVGLVACFCMLSMYEERGTFLNMAERSTSTVAVVTGSDRDIFAEFENRRERARLALERIDPTFETNITTTASVRDNGYPVQWRNCTLPRLFEKKSEPLRVVVLGGSATSRPADRCEQEEASIHAARYSNVLQKLLSQDFNETTSFEVVNMGIGGTTSVMNAVVMDGLVNPTKDDILIWEFAINDGQKASAQLRMLEFWLRRVHALYHSHNLPPPPILVLYLWEENAGMGPNSKLEKQGILTTAWHAQKTLVHKYSAEGWNLQVVNLGATITSRAYLANNRHVLFDDKHHPSCSGVYTIARMIQHAIYSNIASCSRADASPLDPSTAPRPPLLVPSEPAKEIQELLFRDPEVRMASHTHWFPSTGSSALAMSEEDKSVAHHNATLEDLFAGRSAPNRADRKNSYVVPPCHKRGLEFTLLEPDLKWIGIARRGKEDDFEAKINNVTIDFKENQKKTEGAVQGMFWDVSWRAIHTWFRLADYPPSSNYTTISFCQKPNGSKLHLDRIVAILKADNNNTQPTLSTA